MDEKDDTLENAPSEDLYLRSPAPLSPEPSRVDELTWDAAGERDGAGLIYEPLEAEEGEPVAAPRSGPDLADSSSLLFRLALSTAALLVLFVFARGFWWPEDEPRGNPPEWAAAPNLPPVPVPSAVEPARKPAAKPRPADAVEIAEPVAEPTLAEEVASASPPPPKPAPAPRPKAPNPEPVIVEEVPPAPVLPKPERPKPAEPKLAESKPAEPKPTQPKAAPEPASLAQARRLPQPWEEGPQPSGLLKPGPGVEEPVPLDFPRYSYPAAARGTGLRADVKLAVLVDERGRVIDARVREGAPPDLGFAETAVAVAKRIPFQPASRYDIPGKMWTEVILEFVE